MKAYIEEGAWLVCSYDLAGTPQQLQRHLSDESHRVQHISGKRLLTVLDKQTKDCFKCKLPVKQWSGLTALLGGMAVGATIVVVGAVLSGPVGWVALGAVAVVAITSTVAYFAHDCAEPQSGGEWQDFHPTVTIKGVNAILYQHSMLTCGNGGILIAFESLQEAQNTADKANNYAWMEIGLQVISNALIGVVTGYGVYDKADKDLDISTVPLTIASYYETDFVRARSGDTPFDSAVIGAQYTIANFVLGSIHPVWGTEPKLADVVWAAFITYIGYKSDTAEGELSTKAESTVKATTSKYSGKSVVSTTV